MGSYHLLLAGLESEVLYGSGYSCYFTKYSKQTAQRQIYFPSLLDEPWLDSMTLNPREGNPSKRVRPAPSALYMPLLVLLTFHSQETIHSSESGNCSVSTPQSWFRSITVYGSLTKPSNRANSTQSIRIRTLETEAAQLLEENISLREQVIRLTVELDRRNHSAGILSKVSATKRELEKKVQEMMKLVGGLSVLPHVGEGKGKIVTGPKPVEERVWRNEYLLKVEQEQVGLEAIKEDVVYPRKSLRYVPATVRPSQFLT